jgi:hypothetical protein
MREISVEEDRFGYGFDKLLEDIVPGLEDAMEPAVRKGCQVSRKVAKAAAPKKTGDYAKSLSYKVKGHGLKVSGEVGSKRLPGLVHLLEKGHAKIGGGKTRAFPHMAPGFDEGAPAFEAELEKGVDRVLGS